MKYASGIIFLGIALTGLFALALPQNRSASTAIKDVRIFDGEKIIPVGNVVFSGGTISACGPGAAVHPLPAGARRALRELRVLGRRRAARAV